LTHREDWRADVERKASTVTEQTTTQTLAQATGDVLEIAKDAIEGVRDWAGEVADQAREKVAPPPKPKRSKLPLLLVALGLGALVFLVLRRRGAGVDDVAPDAFGAAVEEADAAGYNGERAPLSTPGT
jgi:hypothetical protein